jgi:hypothetical protein
MQYPRKKTVQSICNSGNQEKNQGIDMLPLYQADNYDGHKDNS